MGYGRTDAFFICMCKSTTYGMVYSTKGLLFLVRVGGWEWVGLLLFEDGFVGFEVLNMGFPEISCVGVHDDVIPRSDMSFDFIGTLVLAGKLKGKARSKFGLIHIDKVIELVCRFIGILIVGMGHFLLNALSSFNGEVTSLGKGVANGLTLAFIKRGVYVIG